MYQPENIFQSFGESILSSSFSFFLILSVILLKQTVPVGQVTTYIKRAAAILLSLLLCEDKKRKTAAFVEPQNFFYCIIFTRKDGLVRILFFLDAKKTNIYGNYHTFNHRLSLLNMAYLSFPLFFLAMQQNS